MGKPDTLSRRADHRNRALDNKNIVPLRPESLAVHALEGVQLTGKEQKILSDICKGNHNRDQEESIAKAAQELWGFANRAVHLCGKDNEFGGESGLFVLWLRVKDLYIFYFCVVSLLLF